MFNPQEQLLRVFNGDFQTKEALIEFIHDFIGEEAKARVFGKKSVEHISEAYDLINQAFDNLEQLYGIKEKPKQTQDTSR